MNFRHYVQLPLDVDGIDASIDFFMKNPHDLLACMTALWYGRNIYIGTQKKERGDIF